jgi:hypothetical protein
MELPPLVGILPNVLPELNCLTDPSTIRKSESQKEAVWQFKSIAEPAVALIQADGESTQIPKESYPRNRGGLPQAEEDIADRSLIAPAFTAGHWCPNGIHWRTLESTEIQWPVRWNNRIALVSGGSPVYLPPF